MPLRRPTLYDVGEMVRDLFRQAIEFYPGLEELVDLFERKRGVASLEGGVIEGRHEVGVIIEASEKRLHPGP